MANMSNKNFPHAYGAGRCIAAFSLSHPGGPETMGEADADLAPPAFNMQPVDIPAYPNFQQSVTSTGPGVFDNQLTTAYTPDRQPYNATCFGVYCTGSGTKSLPYRDAIAPYVPASVSPTLNQLLPGTGPEFNEVRPLEIVKQARLGSTHAQYVVQPIEPADPADPMARGVSYYEVALDWKIPPLKLRDTLASGVDFSSWPSTQIANVRDALAQTLWINATYGENSLTECHPEYDLGGGFDPTTLSVLQLNGFATSNPEPQSGWEPMYGAATTFVGDPEVSPGGFVQPAFAPSDPGDPPVTMESMQPPHASLMLKIVSARSVTTNVDAAGVPEPGGPSVRDLVMTVAPVIRIVVPYESAGLVQPFPLGRSLVRPSGGEFPLQPPCVNVEVMQKNSSATDGTITPVFDLVDSWNTIGAET